MSHELRTPLNSILGFAQLLQMDDLPGQQSDAVDHILRAGRHLLDLIDEVLDIARIESGYLELTLVPVAVDEIVSEALELTNPIAARAEVVIRSVVDPRDGYVVTADRQRLMQVLLNLLSNAVKYNEPGGRVDVSCGPSDLGRLRLAVADTGRGIRVEDLDRVFVPFDRLGLEHTGIEGSGVGLALSQHLCQRMGGELGVESVPEVGSTFVVELPTSEPADPHGRSVRGEAGDWDRERDRGREWKWDREWGHGRQWQRDRHRKRKRQRQPPRHGHRGQRHRARRGSGRPGPRDQRGPGPPDRRGTSPLDGRGRRRHVRRRPRHRRRSRLVPRSRPDVPGPAGREQPDHPRSRGAGPVPAARHRGPGGHAGRPRCGSRPRARARHDPARPLAAGHDRQRGLDRLAEDPATADIPVAVVGADAPAQHVRQLLGRGVIGFLAKPIDVRGLLALVDAVRAARGT